MSIYLPPTPHRVDLEGSKYCHVQNIITYGYGKIDWLCRWMLPTIPIICENVSNKSCLDFNYIQKTQWAHMSIFLGVELGDSKSWLVRNIIMYGNKKIDRLWDWMLPKLPIIYGKVSNKSCWDFNYLQKTQWAQISIFTRVELGGSKDYLVRNIIMYRSGKIDWLWVWTLLEIPIVCDSSK